MRYIALVDAKGATYGVVIPDLPGCTSGGRSIDEALQNATEAVRLWAQDALAERVLRSIRVAGDRDRVVDVVEQPADGTHDVARVVL